MKPVLPALLTLSLGLAAGPADALSCMRPDVLRSYKAAADAYEAYVVVSGVMVHDVQSVPEDRNENSPRVNYTARLVGAYLGDEGFTGTFDAPVDVTLDCVSAWCSPLPAQRESVLAFVRKTETGYALNVQPCRQWLFENPEPEQMVALFDCHTSGNCTPN